MSKNQKISLIIICLSAVFFETAFSMEPRESTSLFGAKKIILSERQQKMARALITGNLDLVEKWSFTLPNDDDGCLLVSAINSSKLYVLPNDAPTELMKLDLENLLILLKCQKPELLPNNPEFWQLGEWYFKCRNCLWCPMYDEVVVQNMKCDGWKKDKINWDKRRDIVDIKRMFNYIGKRAGIEEEDDKNKLSFPSLEAHQNSVKAIQKKIEQDIIRLDNTLKELRCNVRKCGPGCAAFQKNTASCLLFQAGIDIF